MPLRPVTGLQQEHPAIVFLRSCVPGFLHWMKKNWCWVGVNKTMLWLRGFGCVLSGCVECFGLGPVLYVGYDRYLQRTWATSSSKQAYKLQRNARGPKGH
ncbi:Protein of unknown function [Pyronema omphalodes CBS 100304]|uniref:Uncharacterized protein n=1 Tax=Pyronema omphalodes (strain CBS 100304) TaxID=1076935 RepID=U4L1U1_PYROM|nr:Protein of unknown function [Pyronema omphalodes CBS 100304]